jgi:Peptidase family M28
MIDIHVVKKVSIKLSRLLILLLILVTIFASLSNTTIAIAAANKNEDADNDYTLCLFSVINCVKDSSLLQKIEESELADGLFINSVIDQVNYTKLEKWVDDLSSFHTRHTKSGYIEDTAYWLKNELQSICEGKVYFHNFTQTDQRTDYHLKNIVCDKKGLAADNLIIISAHYDSRMQDINYTNGRAPGADDNASGVSAILELARILSQIDLKNNIQFVLFSGEEQGQWGSKNYVKYLHDNNIKIDLVINADMIGYPSQGSNKVNIEYDWGNKVPTNDISSYIVGIFMKQIALEYAKLNATLTILSNSDYRPFEALGYTVIGVHDGGAEQNPNYHSTSDTPDTLDLKYLTSITKLLLATILELDEFSH